MADIETIILQTPDFQNPVDFVSSVDEASPEPHGQHEAFDLESALHEQTHEFSTPADAAVHDDVIDIDPQAAMQLGPIHMPNAPATLPEVNRKLTTSKAPAAMTVGKDKQLISAKAVLTKSGPTTPTVKKVLNSGTFGSGATKPVPGNKAPPTTPSTPKTTASTSSTLKKSTTTPSTNPPAKTASTMASSRSPPPPARRTSMLLPPRAPSATGTPPPKLRGTLLSSLTSSLSSKPASAEVTAPSHPSVVSPPPPVSSLRSNSAAPAATRPRASISEAVRRTPSTSSMKASPSAAPPPARSVRHPTSISSIREVRDVGKPLEEMQQKLKEAMDALSVKAQAVAALEVQLAELSGNLQTARADAEAKQFSLAQLQQGKAVAESELQAFKTTLHQVSNEHSQDLALLASTKQQLDAAKMSSSAQNDIVNNLQNQVESLTAEVAAARDTLETLRSSSEQTSSAAAAAAQVEREALLRARTDFETVCAEAEALRASHASTLQDLHAGLSEAEGRAADADALEAQVKQLNTEREDNATKLSELEVEILELKECQEQAEDEYAKALDRLKGLEEELSDATSATQNALDESRNREAQHAQQIAEIEEVHDGELQAVKDELSNVVANLEGLQGELAAAHAAHEQTKLEAQTAAEEHERQLEETEGEFLSKHLELSEEIKRITMELEGQEAQYNARVDAVKAEHELLVQDAFERAKNVAGQAHGQDLLALRGESQATIEQLRAAHQSTVDGLKADHEDDLASQVGELEKKLSNQSLELRATRDDLAKAKVSLDSLRSEAGGLKAQLEDSRAAIVAASASADQASEVERLMQELANFRDENDMLNDVLAVTKESLLEMSSNHTKELEEGARGRVEDIMKLRAAYEEEISGLAAQKSQLSLKLSDLEGEIATLKSRFAADAAAAPKSNGVVPLSSTMVTREELQKVHEAHNMKVHDIVAEHERTVRGLRSEIDGLQSKLDELHQDVTRKSMEIQYLEQEQDENQDSIIRLKADLEQLRGTSDA